MLGTFQQSNLRIEVEASESALRDCLICPDQFRQWLWPQQFSEGLPEQLKAGLIFTSQLGPVKIHHQVNQITANSLHLLMHGGIDGFHQWYWGDGWLQSRIEGVSALPMNLGQTVSLLRLRQFLTQVSA